MGDGQRGQRRFERGLQALGKRRTGHDAVEEQGLDLAVHLALEGRHDRRIRSKGGQLLQQRGRGVAGCVERDTDRHEFLKYLTIRRLTQDVLNPNR